MKRLPYLLLAAAVIAVDAWTKYLVSTHIDVRESVSLIPNLFQLVHVRNTGAAFGIGANADSRIVPLLLNIGAIGVFFVVVAYAFRTAVTDRLLQAGLHLILGGAIGNLIDRFRLGYVVDFLDVYLRLGRSDAPLAGVQRRRLGDLHRHRPALPGHAEKAGGAHSAIARHRGRSAGITTPPREGKKTRERRRRDQVPAHPRPSDLAGQINPRRDLSLHVKKKKKWRVLGVKGTPDARGARARRAARRGAPPKKTAVGDRRGEGHKKRGGGGEGAPRPCKRTFRRQFTRAAEKGCGDREGGRR